MNQPPTPAQKEAVREAARWFARLSSGSATPSDHGRWQRWYQASELNREVWQRMQAVTHNIDGLPARLASATLLGAGHARRQVLLGMATVFGGATLGAFAWRSDGPRAWSADCRSGIGERREVKLADGSQLLLDTDSAVDVRFDGQRRLLVLRRGRVLITTARDAAARPFMIDTRDGRVLALGTRFSVSQDEHGSEVAVLEKAVQLTVDAKPALRLEAGQRASFGPAGIGAVHDNDASVASWEQGSLIAIDRPLGQLIDELSRYRPGVLRCAPEVAGLKVSGTFPITDTDLALTALESTFAVDIVRRTRWWVTVKARA
ncbi:FecR domain-containing protein [Pseudomonas sp. BP8]|uniref:FecR domain-containing protein n=1 Tax=Pseudomonas sp. BP8 TaxID=2817864 RepID=UPI001D33D8E0|nr:transmembrane sensor [Pseudomonas sp. BP8]